MPAVMNDDLTIDPAMLRTVTGGWDWGRTGRAALTGAGLTFNASVGAGRSLAGTPGAYVGGAVGTVSSVVGAPLFGVEMAGLDALDQANGRSELKIDNANIRAGGPG
jgi:hypothetical protein